MTFWNDVAVNVIVVDAGKANAEAFLWYAFEQAAVYNAVNGITGRYELYKWNPKHPDEASPASRSCDGRLSGAPELLPAVARSA